MNLPAYTFSTTVTFAVVESEREPGKYSVRFTLDETGDHSHLSGPWDDVETATEHLVDILGKRGLRLMKDE